MLETQNQIFGKKITNKNSRLRALLGGILSIAIFVSLFSFSGSKTPKNTENLRAEVIETLEIKAPNIDSISPLSVSFGSLITITGSNFGETASENQVKLGETPVSVSSVQHIEDGKMEIVATIPRVEEKKASITITTSAGSSISPYKLNILEASSPSVSEVIPSYGEPGDFIYIYGENFDTIAKNNIVEFTGDSGNPIRAEVHVVYQEGNRVLKVKVPYGIAEKGSISVTIGGMTADSGSNFVLGEEPEEIIENSPEENPQIISFSKTNVQAGEKIIITGSNLISPKNGIEKTEVWFDEAKAEIINYSTDPAGYDNLMTKAPAGITGEVYVTVKVNGKSAFSQTTIIFSSQNIFINESQTVAIPNIIDDVTNPISFYTFVSDADGAMDIVGVNIDLSPIGGSPMNSMLPGEIVGTGQAFELINYNLTKELSPGKTYNLKISATDSFGNIGKGEIIIKTPGEPEEINNESDNTEGAEEIILKAPRNFSANVEGSGIRLSWSAPEKSEENNYRVYYSKTSGNYLHQFIVGKPTEYLATGLMAGERYYFVVTATDENGTEGPVSKEVSAIFPAVTTSATHTAAPIQQNWEPAAITVSKPWQNQQITFASYSENWKEPIYPEYHSSSTPKELSQQGPAEIFLFSGLLAILSTGFIFRKKALIFIRQKINRS